VVDGGSADATVEIAERHGARAIMNPWPGFPAQRRFALAKAVGEWVFVCDSDEEVPPELASEIDRAITDASAAGFRVRRRQFSAGGWTSVVDARRRLD
jgi:glycosyltransferase involved in cell wall biosynthesis